MSLLKFTLILFVSLSTTFVQGEISSAPDKLLHYWNLFKLKDVFLSSTLQPGSNGILFKAANNEYKFEIRVHDMLLTIILPENQEWHKRIVVNLKNGTKRGRQHKHHKTIDLMIVFNENSLFIFNGCQQIFSDQVPSMNFKFEDAKIEILPNWKGFKPNDFQIGSGFPINQKCKKVNNYSADYLSEEIEKINQTHLSNKTFSSTFFNNARLPTENYNGCLIDDSFVEVGESKITNCTKCTCVKRDEVVCQVEDCPRVHCSNPIVRKGDCCPSCGKQCWFQNKLSNHPHGEIFWPAECYRCECWDGLVSCQNVNVPCKTPNCPARDWVIDQKYQCCPKCRDNAAFCEVQPCHQFANCYNEKRGPKCICKEGFHGNGTNCVDIDECNFSPDAKEQLGGCMEGTLCKNTQGSFECTCFAGYQRISDQVCVPLLRV